MKRILIWACGILSFSPVAAQDLDDFDSFMKKESMSFDSFLDEASRDFLNFMRDPWKQLHSKEPDAKRTKPEPVKPVVYDEKTAPKDEKPTQLTIEEILNLTTGEDWQAPVMKGTDVDLLDFDKPVQKPVNNKKKPTVIIREEQKAADTPVAEEKKPEQTPAAKPNTSANKPVTTPTTVPSPLSKGGAGRMEVTYGGAKYFMGSQLKGSFRLTGVKENDVADAYEKLYKSDYADILKDMRTVKKELSLNDWGMYTFVKAYSEANTSNANESIIMQHFLLSQLGFKAKIAREADNSKLMLFLATDCKVYGHPYTTINGLNYYYLNGSKACRFFMYTHDAPQAKAALSMKLTSSPALKGDYVYTVRKAVNSNAKVETNVPTALMDFYRSYPQCDYSVYVKAPVNPTMAAEILEPLRTLVQGKSEKDAANLLINFVQTGFEYATDEEQFGYEKPFFVEELFYYPNCDCEDRSFLFSWLVRNILGLDVVLLDYPEHIATAVKFTSDVDGDFIMVNGSKYTVCDPTYIGASIGMTMPQFKSVKAKVLKY